MATSSSQDDNHLKQQSTSSPSQGLTSSKHASDVPSVRFSSAVEEISPAHNAPSSDESAVDAEADRLKALSLTLRGRPLQERRMNTFHFEAFSLPPSRVPSRDEESYESTRHPTPNSSSRHSPHGSPRLSALTSPPLTPAGSYPYRPGEKQTSGQGGGDRYPAVTQEPREITPQATSSLDKPPSTAERRSHATHRHTSSDNAVRRTSSADSLKSHRRGMFSVGTGSTPASRESSPSRTSASHFYSKPMTPGGDAKDPYAKGRRPPQQQHPNRRSIDVRFIFSRKKKHSSPTGSKSGLSEKRASGLFSSRGSSEELGFESTLQGSMADLKRFFRKTGHSHKKTDSSSSPVIVGPRTPPTLRPSPQIPFSEDHGLSSKYGKLGKVLGSGAGGSVRLMRRKDDGTIFAVKEFRARHAYETEREYVKKVTAEFCVGSTLHHGNIIETLDILQEKGRWFEVMEYAPYDLHSVGLAHRDLKLDNVVVSDKGIIKIIDFGSAHVFRYPFETDTVPAKGIVGSDPYLAPEVYSAIEYDAASADIWSLAIIFCCMTLRRFPWKIPRMADNSFKLFAAEPTPGHDPAHLVIRSRQSGRPATGSTHNSRDEGQGQDREHHRRGSSHDKQENPEATSIHTGPPSQDSSIMTGERKESVRGPWRILRLLPRECRHIIHRMLDLDATTRAKMDKILKENWVADTIICQQLENGVVARAEDHEHVLEPSTSRLPKS